MRGRLRRLVERRPFTCALVVLVAAMTPAFVLSESNRQADIRASCRDQNDANAAIRRATNRLLDGLLIELDPRAGEVVERLRASGIAPPGETDEDCDGDGVLDDGDYG